MSSHPLIVEFKGFKTDEGKDQFGMVWAKGYILTEFLEDSLGNMINLKKKEFSHEDIRGFASNAADALHFLHTKDFFHNDLRPEAFFLCERGVRGGGEGGRDGEGEGGGEGRRRGEGGGGGLFKLGDFSQAVSILGLPADKTANFFENKRKLEKREVLRFGWVLFQMILRSLFPLEDLPQESKRAKPLLEAIFRERSPLLLKSVGSEDQRPDFTQIYQALSEKSLINEGEKETKEGNSEEKEGKEGEDLRIEGLEGFPWICDNILEGVELAGREKVDQKTDLSKIYQTLSKKKMTRKDNQDGKEGNYEEKEGKEMVREEGVRLIRGKITEGMERVELDESRVVGRRGDEFGVEVVEDWSDGSEFFGLDRVEVEKEAVRGEGGQEGEREGGGQGREGGGVGGERARRGEGRLLGRGGGGERAGGGRGGGERGGEDRGRGGRGGGDGGEGGEGRRGGEGGEREGRGGGLEGIKVSYVEKRELRRGKRMGMRTFECGVRKFNNFVARVFEGVSEVFVVEFLKKYAKINEDSIQKVEFYSYYASTLLLIFRRQKLSLTLLLPSSSSSPPPSSFPLSSFPPPSSHPPSYLPSSPSLPPPSFNLPSLCPPSSLFPPSYLPPSSILPPPCSHYPPLPSSSLLPLTEKLAIIRNLGKSLLSLWFKVTVSLSPSNVLIDKKGQVLFTEFEEYDGFKTQYLTKYLELLEKMFLAGGKLNENEEVLWKRRLRQMLQKIEEEEEDEEGRREERSRRLDEGRIKSEEEGSRREEEGSRREEGSRKIKEEGSRRKEEGRKVETKERKRREEEDKKEKKLWKEKADDREEEKKQKSAEEEEKRKEEGRRKEEKDRRRMMAILDELENIENMVKFPLAGEILKKDVSSSQNFKRVDGFKGGVLNPLLRKQKSTNVIRPKSQGLQGVQVSFEMKWK